jgi:hypothetical protein
VSSGESGLDHGGGWEWWRLVVVWLGEHQDVGGDPAVRCGQTVPIRAVVCGCLDAVEVPDEVPAVDGGVEGDDVLEVEQVGVLRAGHDGPGRVD